MTEFDPIWLFVIGVLAGIAFASAVWAWRYNVKIRAAFEKGLTQDAEKNTAERRLLDERLDIRTREMTRLEARIELLESQATTQRKELDERTSLLGEQMASEAALQARLEETRKAFVEKEALFKESSDALKQEFELLANRIFERQGESQQKKLATVLSPFKDQIIDFRKRIEEVYHTDTKDRASLLNEVRNLQQASERINQETENLTRALKGDIKVQGNWGEMVLERVLEESGLRAGHEYFTQEAKRSEEGELKRPDVLIRLPDDKDVVIDAKVSLLAYEKALAAEEEDAREAAMRQHMLSLRAHVKRLSEQDYDELSDVRSLDFVLLFVPIESAFTMAMEYDQRLFTEAFEKRIVIVSPTTLMMTLRIIHNVWRYEKQNRNAQEIARKAGALYDKLRVLVEDMDQLGKQLGAVEKTYESAYNRLATGKGNLVRQVEQFRELGAKVKKPLPKNLIDDASSDEQ
ncbi:MAG: DNA recombination protein RmuC [Gammaproteobacteria bacterium]|nr:DNA recombination protein RmuC [Gammaproteobacteria bacterium]